MRTLLLALAFLLAFVPTAFSQHDFYSRTWSRVYYHEMRDLPRSALGVVDSIYTRAKKEKNIQQFTKTVLYQGKIALAVEADAELAVVRKFRREIETTQPPQRNILESMLAEMYWEYFKAHRHLYYERTYAIDNAAVEDFRLWDTRTMMMTIHRHYQNSVKNEKELQNIHLNSLDEILADAENSRVYRPTLFDLLAHRAIDFYSTDNEWINKLDKPVFLANEVVPPIYQSLLSFHEGARDTAAYVDAAIVRLKFLSRTEIDADRHLIKQFYRLRRIYRRHSASTLIDYEIARALTSIGETGEGITNQFKLHDALLLCDSVNDMFPASAGAEKCTGLRQHILKTEVSLRMENYVPINRPSLAFANFRNIDSLAFLVYPVSDQFVSRYYDSHDDSVVIRELSKLVAISQWEISLGAPEDHRSHDTEVRIPPLPHGRYIIYAKPIAVAGAEVSEFAFSFIQVTDLALFQTFDGSGTRFQVVDRNTGRPLGKAQVHLTSEPESWTKTVINKEFVSDNNGFFELRGDNAYVNVVADINYNSDRAVFGQNIYNNRSRKGNESYTVRAFLFTDRSIYRPGQTVHFKGILLKIKEGGSSLVTGEYVEVFLSDVNLKDVESVRLKSNAFGSFSGEFKIPTTGLTGEYSIAVDEDDEGDSEFYEEADGFLESMASISVEEYKRPTFDINFTPLTGTVRIGDTIRVSANVMAFNGAKIINAKVSYRVIRVMLTSLWQLDEEVTDDYPGSDELVDSVTRTDSNGDFVIRFPATADDSVEPAQRPVFVYQVTTEVTDVNGETRTAFSRVKVGYHAMKATVTINPTVNRTLRDNIIRINTENLNGQFIPSKGTLKIYKLTSPKVPLRKRNWEAPELRTMTEAEFRNDFPHEAWTDEDDREKWQKGKLVNEISFDSGQTKEVKLTTTPAWENGSYVIELSTSDPQGQPVDSRKTFQLVDPKSKLVLDQQLLVLETDKITYKENDMIRVRIGSASDDVTATIDVGTDETLVRTYVEHLSGSKKELLIPVPSSKSGTIYLYYNCAVYNSFIRGYKTVSIEKESQLDIEAITFRDKLQPGSKETWSFEIKGTSSGRKEAEILASMYDASLDEFKKHDWNFALPTNWYGAHNGTFGNNSFEAEMFKIVRVPRRAILRFNQFYDEFDMFGLSIGDVGYTKRQYQSRLYSSGINLTNPSKVTRKNIKGLADGFIRGKITSSKGEIISGVNVLVKGTTRGTATDAGGEYLIEAHRGEMIVYSFVGYATAEAIVGSKNTMNVLMEDDVKVLEEVVVVGYGVQTKKSLTSSVVTVSETVTTEGVGYILGDLDQTLQGRVAGVQIVSGAVTNTVLIRGLSSMDQKKVLYIVDGEVVASTTIPQDDVASINVIKGEAAVALYGSRAFNGVVIISTKSGQRKIDNELAKVNARKNFAETAFFFPHLTTDDAGKVRFTFTMPESVTRWKLQLFAHTRDLNFAEKTLFATTQKELMVTPNMPRFLRSGDEVVLAVKISNMSSKLREGKASLQLVDPVTGQSLDVALGNLHHARNFRINGKGSTELSWLIKVPAGISVVQYRVVAKAGNFSDGEQNVLPVLSNRILVTETMPMFVRAGQSKTFRLNKLSNISSSTLTHHRLTLESTSNPAWYAIKALPYLMEFPYECAEQLFSRYYANTLASHILNGSPRIREVVDKWDSKGTTSSLESNTDVKSMLIAETPWLREAEDETEQQKRIGMLFDVSLLKAQQEVIVTKLSALQVSDGGFTWFAGSGYSNRYISQHIASTFGHLNKLGVTEHGQRLVEMIQKDVEFLDNEIIGDYRKLEKDATGNRLEYMSGQHITYDQVHYLYMKSFFPDNPVSDELRTAVNYYMEQSKKYWVYFGLSQKAMIALVHHRNNNDNLAREIIKSLKESSITSDELGMYWKDNRPSWYWYELPIETHALLMEAFAEISDDKSDLEEMRTWLLKNKLTNRWKTTKATTEAVYAILLMGSNWALSDNVVDVSVGGQLVKVSSIDKEAGTGYYKTSWNGTDIKPVMSEVTMKSEKGMATGALYWQYFEDIDRITSAETPIRLEKKVFVVTNQGVDQSMLEVVDTTQLAVGDLVRIRIELTVDREMEFLHLKDQRSSGMEPVDVLSDFKWQGGLGYYQSTRDAATHFFFDKVRAGSYIFEYDLRVNNKGNFSNGIASIESMYAPEFTSHSAGLRITIK